MLNKNDTLTGICNSALAAIGHTSFIENIEDDDPVCATLRIILEQAILEVQGHEYACWDELIREEKLVKRAASASGVNGRTEYNLPFRMIAPVDCFLGDTGERVRYQIRGGFLECCKDGNVWLRYVAHSFEPSTWSPELRTCVIKLLSARALAALVKDFTTAAQLESQFWSKDFMMWAGTKKNKALRSDFAGDDAALSKGYPNPYGLGTFDWEGY